MPLVLSKGRLETIAPKKESDGDDRRVSTPWPCFGNNVAQLQTSASYVYVAVQREQLGLEHFVFDLAGRLLLTVPCDSRLRFVCFANDRVAFVREHVDIGIIPTIVSYALSAAALSPNICTMVDVPEQICSQDGWLARTKVWFVAPNTWWFADGQQVVAVCNGRMYVRALAGRVIGFSNHPQVIKSVIVTVADPIDNTLRLIVCTLILTTDGTGCLNVGPNLSVLTENGVRLQEMPFANVKSVVHRDGMAAWVSESSIHVLLFHDELCVYIPWHNKDYTPQTVCDIVCSDDNNKRCKVSCMGDRWCGSLCLVMDVEKGRRWFGASLECTQGRHDDDGSDVVFTSYTTLTVGPIVSLAMACVGEALVDHLDALTTEMDIKLSHEIRESEARQRQLDKASAELLELQVKHDKHKTASTKLLDGLRKKLEDALLTKASQEIDKRVLQHKADSAYKDGFEAAKLAMEEAAQSGFRGKDAEIKQLRAKVCALEGQLTVKQSTLDEGRSREQQSLRDLRQQLDAMTERYEAANADLADQLHDALAALQETRAEANRAVQQAVAQAKKAADAALQQAVQQAVAQAKKAADAALQQAVQQAVQQAAQQQEHKAQQTVKEAVAQAEAQARETQEARQKALADKEALKVALADKEAALKAALADKEAALKAALADKEADLKAALADKEAASQAASVKVAMANLAVTEAERKLQHSESAASDRLQQSESTIAFLTTTTDKLRARIAELERTATQSIVTPPPSPPCGNSELANVLHDTNSILVTQIKATQDQVAFLQEQLRSCTQDKTAAQADVRASSARICALEAELARLQQEQASSGQLLNTYYQKLAEFKQGYEQQRALNDQLMRQQAERISRKQQQQAVKS